MNVMNITKIVALSFSEVKHFFVFFRVGNYSKMCERGKKYYLHPQRRGLITGIPKE
jgi:hypothetical protein